MPEMGTTSRPKGTRAQRERTRRTRNVMSGRPYERMLNFSDGVVAVAATVMVLPVVDLEGPTRLHEVSDIIRDHAPLIAGYFTAFLIVVLIWLAHHRVMARLEAYDTTVMLLNAGWLATIAFFPWCTELIGEASGFRYGVGPLFFGTLAVNTLMLLLITWHARRFPDLLRPGAVIVRGDQWNPRYFLIIFIGLGVASVFYPYASGIALYPLLILGPVLLSLARRMPRGVPGLRRANEILASRPDVDADEGGHG